MSRLRDLARHYRNAWRWLSLAVLVLAWVACAGSERDMKVNLERSGSCASKVSAAIIRSSSCTEAELRANLLLHDDADCRDIYGDAGWHRLPCSKDGGAE